MARRNPEVERLEMLLETQRKQIASMLADPGDFPFTGCGDNSCIVARPSGMATNGGCRCDVHRLRSALNYWRRRSVFLEETIRIMKGDPNVE